MPAFHLLDRKGLSNAAALFMLTVLVSLLNPDRNVAAAGPERWQAEWPRTDFSRHLVPLTEIKSGGPPRDGIPSIDMPRFEQVQDGKASGWAAGIGDVEPVVSLVIGADARAYPLRVLIWHEIVNDTVGATPVAVTYCPLCNTVLVFERASDGRTLDFGTTGKLRNSDLVMYDRQTESWWQQFTGDAIVGAMTGRQLRLIPSRLESFAVFRQRFPQGKVLVPNDPGARDYGANPYVGYDATGQKPFLYHGTLPEGIEPMQRVVAVETAPGASRSLAAQFAAAPRHDPQRRADSQMGTGTGIRPRPSFDRRRTGRRQRSRAAQARRRSRRRALRRHLCVRLSRLQAR